MAPHACDSGIFKGKRRIWGARANVRRALYLAAFIASRHDPNFKAFRKQLQDVGKSLKLAVTVCARKLLTIINAMLKAGQNYRKISARIMTGATHKPSDGALMGLWKAVFRPKLKARAFENHKTEAKIGVCVLNRMTRLGRPSFERIA